MSTIDARIRGAEIVILIKGLQFLILEHSLERLEQNAGRIVGETGASLEGEIKFF